MTPADRVKVIKEIADALDDTDWGDIDLTLGEFGLPWIAWNGSDKRQYVMQRLRGGEADDRLSALHTFLTAPGASPAEEARELPWDEGRFRLFGSHRASDKELVGQVKRQLEKSAIDLFVAHEDIDPTEEWLVVIESALGSCDALAAFLTPDFRGSDWCDQEVGFAIRNRILIVPLCLGVMPYGFMARYQGLKFKDQTPTAIADSIFDVVVQNPLTSGRMAEALVTYMVDADTFARSNRAAELLARVPQWSPPLLRRLEEAIEANSQVRGAFKAPGMIRSIIAKNGG